MTKGMTTIKTWISCWGVALLLALACSSCCTQTLWDRIDPNERVWIPDTDITEAELIQKGVEYKKYGGDFPHGYLVKKSSMQKFSEYTILTLATPITLTVDSVLVVVYLWASVGGPGLR